MSHELRREGTLISLRRGGAPVGTREARTERDIARALLQLGNYHRRKNTTRPVSVGTCIQRMRGQRSFKTVDSRGLVGGHLFQDPFVVDRHDLDELREHRIKVVQHPLRHC